MRAAYLLAGVLLVLPLTSDIASRVAPAAEVSDDGLLVCGLFAEPELCAHGSEPPPPGIDARRRPSVDELRQRRRGRQVATETAAGESVEAEVAPTTWSIACLGDGTSGRRVQAIYARAADVPDRFADVRPLFGQYAADADYRIHRAAGETGGGRRIRYVTTSGSSCQLEVARATLTRTGDDSFTNTISELRGQGFDRSDRKYLVWVDAAVGICGVAQMYRDDRPGGDNANERGGMFARVDAPCWGYAEDHELLHTFGAVQWTAPNTSNAGHCVDENDVMCYADSSTTQLVDRCPSAPRWHIDCGANDYFHASPPSGSYLAQRWNSANSSWLERAEPPPQPPAVSLTAPGTMLAGTAVALSSTSDVPAGRTHKVAWTTSRTDCGFDRPNAASTGYWCKVTAATSTQVTVRITDSEGLTSSQSATIRLPVPAEPRATALVRSASTRTIAFGRKVTIRGTLTDAGSGRPVIGMPVTLWAAPAGATRWSALGTATTGRDGKLVLRHAPASNTAYKLVSGSTTTWATGRSKGITVRVAPRVTATPSATTAAPGSRIRISGAVQPSHSGQPVTLQRRTSTGWTDVQRVRLNSRSRYRFDVQLPDRSTRIVYRIRKPADTDHAAATSPRLAISVT